MIDVKKEISEYFDYIKEIYLRLFDKILIDSKKKYISNLDSSILEFDDNEFRIKNKDKITFGLNIKKFIEENNLRNEDLEDINDLSKRRVKYYLNYSDDITKIIKDSMLEQIILFFIKDSEDFISVGTANLISNIISRKFNLTTLNVNFKEGEVVKLISNVVGEKEFLELILNGGFLDVSKFFNKYVVDVDTDYKSLIKSLQDEYIKYSKNRNKVYYIDSLYFYEEINYRKGIDILNKIIKFKGDNSIVYSKRCDSILECLEEMYCFKKLFDSSEQENIYYAITEVKKISSSNSIEINYNRLLEIESSLEKLSTKIWHAYINSDNSPIYLVSDSSDSDIINAHLITNDNVSLSCCDRQKYGFIYKISRDAIIYASPNFIAYEEALKENINTKVVGSRYIEISNQIYSTLITPRLLMKKMIEGKYRCNNVLLERKKVQKVAIFGIGDENHPTYSKAEKLANEYNLPLILFDEKSNT